MPTMNYYRQMQYYDHPYYMDDYLNDVAPFQKADLAFQANEFSRWELFQKSCFILSVLLGKAPSKFIFADAAKCLEAALERGDPDDIKYFQDKVDRSVKYINIDSNNRNNVLVEFMKGEVPIPHGKFDIGGASVTVNEDNDTYETMPLLLKQAFNGAIVSLSIYTDATREELSDLFLVINDGKPLNLAEILNAMTTRVANDVRYLASTYGAYFAGHRSWFSSTSKNRRGIDHYIAQLAYTYVYSLNGKSISPANIKDFYRHNSDGEKEMGKFCRLFKNFMKDVMTEDAYAIVNRNSIFDLFHIYVELCDRKLKINDNKAFLIEYIEVVCELLKSNERYDGYGDEKFKDPKSFLTMIGGTQKTNNLLRLQLIKERFDFESLTTQLDPVRRQSPMTIMMAASRDGFKTPSGQDIDMSKLHTAEYHGGHAHTPYSQGGSSDLDNCVVQTAKENLELGANPVEPFSTS